MKNEGPSRESKRTILYYPTISLPTGTWVRQALLYWDEVASIVPQDWENNALIAYSPDVEYLIAEGEFRPIRPDGLIYEPSSYQLLVAFEDELRSLVASTTFRNLLGPPENWRIVSRIHQDKISANMFGFFAQEGLAMEDREDPQWYLFENKTALFYMAVLAKYLADIDIQATIAGTDRREYESLIFEPAIRSQGFACLGTRFSRALPTPAEQVPLRKIVEFKRKRRNELLNFRQLMDDFQGQMAQAQTVAEVKQQVMGFRESIERNLKDLGDLLKDANIATVAGSLKTIVSVKSPTLWSGLLAMAGKATKVAHIRVEWLLAGLGVLGAIEVSSQLIDRRNERRAVLRESPFAYLYHAKAKGLL